MYWTIGLYLALPFAGYAAASTFHYWKELYQVCPSKIVILGFIITLVISTVLNALVWPLTLLGIIYELIVPETIDIPVNPWKDKE